MRARLRLRRRRREATEDGFSWGESLIRGLVDLFLLTLLWIVAQQPEIGLGNVKVIEVSGAEEEKRAEGQSSDRGNRVLLRIDGALLWNDEPLNRDAIVERIAALDANKTVSLVIETGDSGTGAVRELIELQIAISKAGCSQRVEVLYRPQAAPVGGPKQ
jgi:hypothetical protein